MLPTCGGTMIEELGLGLVRTSAPAKMGEWASLAEELGFDSVWVAEDYFQGGAFSVATACALATTRVQVGIGVVNPFTRHPALLAMETASLDILSQGRITLGLGTGSLGWIRQMGINLASPLSGLREGAQLVRRLLQGEEVTFSGRCFSLNGVRLEGPPYSQRVPIYLGVKGPKALMLSGELLGDIADGVHLSLLTSVPYVRFAKEQIAKGIQKTDGKSAGIPGEIKIAAFLPIVVDRNVRQEVERDRAALRSFIAKYIVLMGVQLILLEAGMTPEQVEGFRKAAQQGEDPSELVTDDLVETFGVVGSPEACVGRLRDYIQAGVNTIIACEVPGIPIEHTARSIAEHIMPRLR